MNKELFVSSMPHETKVGLVEDDLLAEIYLERENEYTLAGSIYKGRVTRVLPGMQSAFVDIGLERDAFLYVSDFMELEEHDDDLTESIPANRGVQDMRPQQAAAAATESISATEVSADEGTVEADRLSDAGDGVAQSAAGSAETDTGNGSENRDRSIRGRRRRGRSGRRDGRDSRDGRDRNDRGADRGDARTPEPRFSRPVETSRPVESPRVPSGPPAGYEPILLPGESISKYSRRGQQAPARQQAVPSAVAEAPAETVEESSVPIAATFPEDEPIFAAEESVAEPLHEEHEDAPSHDEPVEAVTSASTTADWNQQFRRVPEVIEERVVEETQPVVEAATLPALGWPGETRQVEEIEEVVE
jgi:ribonuclease G